jgi:hypothetical protein
MNNIHLLPTHKPSRLWTNNLRRKLELDEFPEQHPTNIAKHIYITSDEEIKEGDLILPPSNIPVRYDGQKYKGDEPLKCWKKIILTTDQDLINDGVQAIDDDFLEWFVMNPSCEFVEVDCWNVRTKNKVVYEPSLKEYEIIIPQEEPKIDSIFNEANDRFSETLDKLSDNSLKQETLEEAALKKAQLSYYGDEVDAYVRGSVFGAKWQAERMYSEEDLKAAWIHGAIRSPKEFKHLNNFDVWFEQFKKNNND